MKRLFSVMLLVALGVSLAFAGGRQAGGQSSGSQKVKLRLLMPANEDIRQILTRDYIAPALAREYPDWEIEIENDVGGDKLRIYNATGDMPDVFYADGMSVTQPLIDAGHIENLLPYITADGFADKYKVKSVIAPWKDGKLYNLDPGTDSYYAARLFIRKSMFAANNIPIPKTYAEFVNACKAFVAKGIAPITAPAGWGTVRMVLMQTFVMAEDPQGITDFYNGKAGFTDPRFVSALSKVEELYKLGAFPPDFVNIEYGTGVNQFTSGQVPMFTFFTWTMSHFENDPDVDILSFPQVSPNVDMNSYVQIWGGPLKGYGVSAVSQFKDAAVKAAELCTMQDAIYFNSQQKVMSALDTGIQITGLSPLAQKNLDLFNAAANKLPSLCLIWGPQVDTELEVQFSALLSGQTNARAVLETLEKIRLGK